MSSVFDENLSMDALDVYSGSWNVATAFEGPFSGPKKFDVRLPLQRPFRYDPRLGNLLLEYRNFSTLASRFHTDSASIPGGPVKMIFSDGDPNALVASAGSDGADVVEIVWSYEDGGTPYIAAQPVDQVLEESGTARFEVSAVGAEPLRYHWYRNGNLLSDAGSSTLVLDNLGPSDSGAITVVISNSFGVVTSKVARLEILTSTTYAHVVPRGLESVEGSGAWATFSNPIHMQEVYHSSEFVPTPVYIRELRFRPDSKLSAMAITQTVSRVAVRLSTTKTEPAQMSKTFSFNAGSDETLVYDGSWELRTAFNGPAQGPKDFDIVLKFQKPFFYDPTRGNLCVDFRNYGGLPVRFHHDALSNGSTAAQNRRPVGSAFSDQDPNALVASVVVAAASAVELGYSLGAGTAPLVLRKPLATTTTEGGTARFQVHALGSMPLHYQWFGDGIAISGETGSELVITNASPRDVGVYSVVVSNAFGVLKTPDVSLSVIPRDSLELVVPGAYSAVEGSGASAGLSVKIRLQEMYSASMFPLRPIVIHAIRFRPDITYAVGPFSGVLDNIVFRMATSSKSVDNMSRTFDENFGPDVQEVFRGEWSISTSFAGPANGPKEFDVTLPLHRSFKYDPRLGNLLLEYRNYSTLPLRFHTDAASGAGNLLAMVFNDGQPDAAIGSVANSAGDVLELVYTLDESVPPVLEVGPVGTVAVEGDEAQFTATAYGGSPLYYFWFFNGALIPGAESSTLNISQVSRANEGLYTLAISNRNGVVTSSPAMLSVVEKPSRLAFVPNSLETIEGDGASAAVSVAIRQQELYAGTLFPSGPLRITQLRFRVDSKLGTGDAAFSTTIPNIQFRMSTTHQSPGNLSYVFSENVGADELTVFDGPWHLTSRATGSPGESKTFDILLPLQRPFVFDSALGNLLVETRTFQRADRLYVLDGATHSQDMQRVFIEDPSSPIGVGGDSSATVLLIGYEVVDMPPSIVEAPIETEVVVGNGFTLSVRASGSLPLSYRWRFNGAVIDTESGSSLTITNASFSQAGVYSVEITNLFGQVNSGDVVVTVKPGPTIVALGSSQARSSDEAAVDCVVEANGGENAVSFSLSFDQRLLAFRDFIINPDLRGASLNMNTTQIASGKVGLAVALPTSERLSQGPVNLGRFIFRVAPITSNVVSIIDFSDQPVVREVVDSFANPLSAKYHAGSLMVLFHGFEADVAPRPEGDRRLTLGDWVQIGRFVAGLDEPSSPQEYQRVDCAPAETAGDGRLSVKDWVQSGRYAASLDAVAVAGGPFSNILSSPLFGPPSLQDVAMTVISLEDFSGEPGQTVSVPITLTALGGEAAIGFSIKFDPAILTFESVDPDGQAGGALFNINSKQSSIGRVGVALALPGGTQFSAGIKHIARAVFTVRSVRAGSSALTFGDVPVVREVVNGGAKEMPAAYGPGAITIGTGAPEIHIAVEGSSLVVTWPASASGFVLESSPAIHSPVWAAVVPEPVKQGQVFQVRLPVPPGGQTYFRLRQ
ncbi:MAG: immunoglobulin domain-containing protein [Verrucomicrobiales bacterium]|nr:immunoglobulin domain-containing protein [Verrucomicrobiales bacterium]